MQTPQPGVPVGRGVHFPTSNRKEVMGILLSREKTLGFAKINPRLVCIPRQYPLVLCL